MTTSCRQQAKTHLWTAHCYHPASNTIIRTRRLCKKPPAAKSAQRRSAVTARKCPDGLPRRATAQAIAATAMQTIAWENGRCKAPHAPEWAGQRPVVVPACHRSAVRLLCLIFMWCWAMESYLAVSLLQWSQPSVSVQAEVRGILGLEVVGMCLAHGATV